MTYSVRLYATDEMFIPVCGFTRWRWYYGALWWAYKHRSVFRDTLVVWDDEKDEQVAGIRSTHKERA